MHSLTMVFSESFVAIARAKSPLSAKSDRFSAGKPVTLRWQWRFFGEKPNNRNCQRAVSVFSAENRYFFAGNVYFRNNRHCQIGYWFAGRNRKPFADNGDFRYFFAGIGEIAIVSEEIPIFCGKTNTPSLQWRFFEFCRFWALAFRAWGLSFRI